MKSAAAMMMTTTIRAAALAALVCACAPPAPSPPLAPIANSLFATEAERMWRLPLDVLEISGLAVSPDGRLFAHDDERAVIYEIDFAQGRFVKRFALGAPLTGDFEGLAIDPAGVFWLITSDGYLLRFNEGASGSRVAYETLDTGLRDVCEAEGLAFLAARESLIVACKQNHAPDMRETLLLYEWRPGDAEARLWRSIPLSAVQQAAGVEDFQPSSVEFDARTGRMLLLSARDAALIEVDNDGVAAARRLGRIHTQAEGTAVLPDGSLVISDEGGDTRALLSVYARVQ